VNCSNWIARGGRTWREKEGERQADVTTLNYRTDTHTLYDYKANALTGAPRPIARRYLKSLALAPLCRSRCVSGRRVSSRGTGLNSCCDRSPVAT